MGNDDNEVKRSIFKIIASGETGTGFLVQDQLHILTAGHIVENDLDNKISVIIDMGTNEQRYASVEKFLPIWDVALLRLDDPLMDIQPLVVGSEKLTDGAEFSTYGFPEAHEYKWYLGKITGPADEGKYEISFDQEYVPQLGGLSGGPVFLHNSSYSVIGFMCDHGPHPARGKFVPVETFYNTLFVEDQPSAQEPWCYVVLSETDKEKLDLRQYTLRRAVERALKLLEGDPRFQGSIRFLSFVYATELISSLAKYKAAVQILCKAKIVIFDITEYEPAVMLLLGIRSVVRRGITIASYGEEFVIGNPKDFPFNITDVNVTSHSAKQQQKGDQASLKGITPPYMIRDKIREGWLRLANLPQYLDLPTFDAIRNLPPDYRAPIVKDILVLCSYSERYKEANWKNLWAGLKEQLDNKSESGSDSRVLRILDLMSPGLVSHTIYETIRRVVLCIIDWTEWRPNVFFELGVRLAVTNTTAITICIIEDKYKSIINDVSTEIEQNGSNTVQISKIIGETLDIDTKNPLLQSIVGRYSKIANQCKQLFDLFEPLEYIYYDPLKQYDEQLQYEKMMYYYKDINKIKISAGGKMGRASVDTYEAIETSIDVGEEAMVTPVYLDLLDATRLFSVEGSEGQAVVLYPNNKELTDSVASGVMQRLLAAWYFITNEYTSEDILQDVRLFDAYNVIGSRLPRLLKANNRLRLGEEIRFTRKLLHAMQEWFVIKRKYSDEDILADAELLEKCLMISTRLSDQLRTSRFEESKLIRDISNVSQTLQTLLKQGEK